MLAIEIDNGSFPLFRQPYWGRPGPYLKPSSTTQYLLACEQASSGGTFKVAAYKTTDGGLTFSKVTTGSDSVYDTLVAALPAMVVKYKGSGNIIQAAYLRASDKHMMYIEFDMSSEVLSSPNDSGVAYTNGWSLDVDYDESSNPVIGFDATITGSPTFFVATKMLTYSGGVWTALTISPTNGYWYFENFSKTSSAYLQVLYSDWLQVSPFTRGIVKLSKIVSSAVSTTYTLTSTATGWDSCYPLRSGVYDATADILGYSVAWRDRAPLLFVADRVYFIAINAPEGTTSDSATLVYDAESVDSGVHGTIECRKSVDIVKISSSSYIIAWNEDSPSLGDGLIRQVTVAALNGSWSGVSTFYDLAVDPPSPAPSRSDLTSTSAVAINGVMVVATGMGFTVGGSTQQNVLVYVQVGAVTTISAHLSLAFKLKLPADQQHGSATPDGINPRTNPATNIPDDLVPVPKLKKGPIALPDKVYLSAADGGASLDCGPHSYSLDPTKKVILQVYTTTPTSDAFARYNDAIVVALVSTDDGDTWSSIDGPSLYVSWPSSHSIIRGGSTPLFPCRYQDKLFFIVSLVNTELALIYFDIASLSFVTVNSAISTYDDDGLGGITASPKILGINSNGYGWASSWIKTGVDNPYSVSEPLTALPPASGGIGIQEPLIMAFDVTGTNHEESLALDVDNSDGFAHVSGLPILNIFKDNILGTGGSNDAPIWGFKTNGKFVSSGWQYSEDTASNRWRICTFAEGSAQPTFSNGISDVAQYIQDDIPVGAKFTHSPSHGIGYEEENSDTDRYASAVPGPPGSLFAANAFPGYQIQKIRDGKTLFLVYPRDKGTTNDKQTLAITVVIRNPNTGNWGPDIDVYLGAQTDLSDSKADSTISPSSNRFAKLAAYKVLDLWTSNLFALSGVYAGTFNKLWYWQIDFAGGRFSRVRLIN